VRALRLTRRFQADQQRLAPRGSRAWTLVAKTLHALANDPILPGPRDEPVELPLSVPGRSIPEAGLVVCYIPAVDEVHLVALVPAPHAR
jgi:hypothetical protein